MVSMGPLSQGEQTALSCLDRPRILPSSNLSAQPPVEKLAKLKVVHRAAEPRGANSHKHRRGTQGAEEPSGDNLSTLS